MAATVGAVLGGAGVPPTCEVDDAFGSAPPVGTRATLGGGCVVGGGGTPLGDLFMVYVR